MQAYISIEKVCKNYGGGAEAGIDVSACRRLAVTLAVALAVAGSGSSITAPAWRKQHGGNSITFALSRRLIDPDPEHRMRSARSSTTIHLISMACTSCSIRFSLANGQRPYNHVGYLSFDVVFYSKSLNSPEIERGRPPL